MIDRDEILRQIQTSVVGWIEQKMNLTAITVSAAYAVAEGFDLVRADGTFTVTLRAATGSGESVYIKNVGAGTISVARAGSDLIDGGTSKSLASMAVCRLRDSAAGVWDVL